MDDHYRGADAFREFLRSILGDDGVVRYSDVELKDGSFNNLFPNLSPWAGGGRIVFRFRPAGANPDESLFDVMLAPWPPGKPKPPPVPQPMLAHDAAWTNGPELGSLGKILDQDVRNLPYVHAGLKTKRPPYAALRRIFRLSGGNHP